MQQIHTLVEPEKIQMGSIDLAPDEDPIFFGSPFFGIPSLDIDGERKIKANNLLILDLNIINFIRQRKNKVNIKGLLIWAAKMGLEVTPIVGLSEQQRTHGNPDKAFKNYIEILKEDYFYDLPSEEADNFLKVIREHTPNIKKNTELFCDYLIIIKHFYHLNLPLEEKIKQFAQLIHERNVPVLAFAFLLGCVFFHVKCTPNDYSNKVVSKVQSDMSISPTRETRKLWNVASDIMLFMAPVELFFNYELGEFNFSYVASGDITCGLTMSEICYGQVVVNNGTCFGMPGLRPTGHTFKAISHCVNKHLKPSPQQSFTRKGGSDSRVNNLKALAKELQNLSSL
ncbi:hypothetical protein BI291_18040 [Thalassotalea sp. PP2-459]|nr:hypothetical protein BI291_18040 [Thalassotalea sp. PP2-459]